MIDWYDWFSFSALGLDEEEEEEPRVAAGTDEDEHPRGSFPMLMRPEWLV